MSTAPGRDRAGAVAFAVAGALFLLYPTLRPWNDETTAAGAAASMASGAWVASHAFGMLGFVLVSLGLLALRDALATTPGAGPAGIAVFVTWIGVGLTLPYYGAEDFGLHALAGAAAGRDVDLLAAVDAVRYQPVAITFFGLGLLALAAGTVAMAVAVRRSGVLPPAGAAALAVGFVLFLPQFFTPPAVRIAHGVLMAVGCLWVASALWRSAARTAPQALSSSS